MQNDVVGGRVVGYIITEGWLNSGTTPTQTAIAEYNVANQDERPQAGTNFERLQQAERQEYVVGPKAVWEVRPVHVTLEEINQIATGRHLFAWGWAVYRDIFRGTPPRISEFCFELTNPRWSAADYANPTTNFVLDTLPCETHNCYDERCEDYARLAREVR